MPGFPWRGSISLPEEAEAYVSGERIQCLLCGKFYRSLGSHINSVHEVDETSYKHRFGIPYRVGLVSATTAKRHAEELTKRISPEERRRRSSNYESHGRFWIAGVPAYSWVR